MSKFAKHWVNLASAKLGAKAIDCSDDFFAPMQRMLQDSDPIFIDDKYDENGKWMDGWESRRKRVPGHDWCIVQLARPGVIHGIEIETTHFTGNYAPAASIEACFCESGQPLADQKWHPLLAKTELKGDEHHSFSLDPTAIVTHIKLHIYPDGGIARLRLYGKPRVDWQSIESDQLVDLAASLNGGVALECNDQHYGDIRNLLTPGRGENMGDGWETRRRRTPGNDWVTIALAHPGVVKKIEIDTAHFKGNYPDRCDIRGALISDVASCDISKSSENWPSVLPEVKLAADKQHHFESELVDIGPISHVRLNIYPDGGISRLRLWSQIANQLSR